MLGLRWGQQTSIARSFTTVTPRPFSSPHNRPLAGSLNSLAPKAGILVPSRIRHYPLHPAGSSRSSLSVSSRRSFRSTPPRRDVFFVNMPGVKQALLVLIKTTLVLLPISWRWGFFSELQRLSSLGAGPQPLLRPRADLIRLQNDFRSKPDDYGSCHFSLC